MVNGNRFNFLRKKRRFQLTQKVSNPEYKIFSDGDEIGIDKNKKSYFNVYTRPAEIICQFYNKYGLMMSNPLISSSKIFLCAEVRDGFGIRRNLLQIKRDDNSGSRLYDTETNLPCEIAVRPETEDFLISARYCPAVNYTSNYREQFSQRLFYSTIIELIHTLIIYLDIRNKALTASVNDICASRLGFRPVILGLNSHRLDLKRFSIIISDNSPFPIKENYNYYSVIKPETSLTNSCLFVRTENIHFLFSEEWIKAYIEKI
jgi:hypothetical protein